MGDQFANLKFLLSSNLHVHPPFSQEVLPALHRCSNTHICTTPSPGQLQDSNIVWIDNNESVVLNSYLRYCYELKPWKVSSGGTIQRLYNDNIAKAIITVPSLDVQNRIVNVLDNFEKICSDLNIGLPAEIEARQKQYEYYRDKLLTFAENGNTILSRAEQSRAEQSRAEQSRAEH